MTQLRRFVNLRFPVRFVVLLALAGAGCGQPVQDEPGVNTSSNRGGSGGKSASGGSSGSSAGSGGSAAGTGGSGGGSTTAGSGGSADSGSGGAPGVPVGNADASAPPEADAGETPADAAGTDAPSTPPPAAGLPENALGYYECESKDTMLFGATTIVKCGTAPPCMSPATIKEGIECCSGGTKLSQLLRGKGGAVFNKLMAPADGMYDVTWWYHCGKNDNFGDPNCGGLPHTPSGCRPHILEVNGTKEPKVFEFPCFPGSWGQIHAATTPLALKAGANSIKIYATPGRDAADLDSIVIYPSGMGIKPVAGAH